MYGRERLDHEFREEARPRKLTAELIGIVPRNIGEIATSMYSQLPPDLSERADLAISQVTNNSENVSSSGGTITLAKSQFEQLLRANERKADMQQFIFNYTAVPVLILPATTRSYFFIQNLDAAANLFIGVGYQPSGTLGLGLKLIPIAAWEPFMIPQNDIWIVGDAAGKCNVIASNG